MKEFIIYDMQTDEELTTVFALDVLEAERKACKELNKGSNDIYALTK